MHIYNYLYINNLYVKQQKGDDAGSADVVEDEDLTFLTFVNHKKYISVQ